MFFSDTNLVPLITGNVENLGISFLNNTNFNSLN